MIRAGIIGASGFTGGELTRILLNHPSVEIGCLYSNTHKGKYVSDVHRDLTGETYLIFTDTVNTSDLDVLFLCLPHGKSREFLGSTEISSCLKIIDLSQDFRLKEKNIFNGAAFTYGLPEAFRKQIASSDYIANPGCFATAIQLALLPLASAGMMKNTVHVNATTGSTGAGTELVKTTGFTWRDSNFSAYKQFAHQHLHEIKETINKLQGESPRINFIPNRGNFTRGIFCSAYMDIQDESINYESLYRDYYSSEPFTHVVDFEPDLKSVVNTNKCFISVKVIDGLLLMTSVIDNLLKGASGQAVQNMNIMFGLNELTGLKIKAVAY